MDEGSAPDRPSEMKMNKEPTMFAMRLDEALVVSDAFEICGRGYSRAGRVLYEGTLALVEFIDECEVIRGKKRRAEQRRVILVKQLSFINATRSHEKRHSEVDALRAGRQEII